MLLLPVTILQRNNILLNVAILLKLLDSVSVSSTGVHGSVFEELTIRRDIVYSEGINAAQKLQLELSDSAEQPAASSVEQSAPMDTADGADPSHLKILSIRDVQRWLAEEPIASCSNADMQRILGRHWLHELLRNSCFVHVL